MFCENAFLIPLFPLAGFLWILLSGLAKKWFRNDIRIGDRTAAIPSIILIACAWAWSIGVLFQVLGKGPGWGYHQSFEWLRVGAGGSAQPFMLLHFGWWIDSMTAIMLIVVTTVAAMVQVFSFGYMAGDSRFPRFYGYLSLFTMAMLILVLANNLVELFIAWELMGLASYLLIGFWFEKPSAMRAAKKAFMVTRVGDVGFFFGIGLLLSLTGTLDFVGLVVANPSGTAPAAEASGWQADVGVAAGPRLLHKTAPVYAPEGWPTVGEHAGGEHAGAEGGHGGGSEHGASAVDQSAADGEHASPGSDHSSSAGTEPAPAGADHPAEPAPMGERPNTSGLAGLAAPEIPRPSPTDPAAIADARQFMLLLGVASILIFCGAIGKSAQFPLHVWLPDAMEGPTPVSALIHAATMVAAGVYLVARMYPVFDFGGPLSVGALSFRPLDVVAIIGTITAAMSALIALTQPDIKRILAYSTCSQLGFMVAALGCGGTIMGHGEGAHAEPELLKLGFTGGMFHLMTHAFFKGLLFLGSGSVIHGTGTQDVWEMGGLKRYMPRTRLTYTMGYVALAGFPFIAAGFYSKDMILDAAWEYNRLIFWILLGTAGLTAFYMTRQMMLVFEGRWSGGPKNPEPGHGGHDAGSAHGGHDSHGHDAHGHDAHGHDAHAGHDHGGHDDGGHAAHDAPGNGHGGHDDAHGGHGGHGHHGEPHESGWVMVGPLCLLAVLAIGSGLVGMPGGWLWGNAIYPFLHYSRVGLDSTPHQAITPMVFFPGLVLPILAALFGRWIYHDRVFRPTASRTPSRFEMRLYGLSLNKFYFDEIYWKLLIVPLFPLTNMLKFVDIWIVDGFVKGMGWIGLGLSLLWGRFDRAVIDGAVNGVAQVSRAGGNLLRTMQTGQIQNYILVALGGAMLLIWALVRGQVFH